MHKKKIKGKRWKKRKKNKVSLDVYASALMQLSEINSKSDAWVEGNTDAQEKV